MRAARWAAAAAIAAAACGGPAARPPEPVPQAARPRLPTAGDPLLAWLPAGANVVVELDLARLRSNPVVGPVAAAAATQLPARMSGLAGADVVVLAAYAVGGAEADSVLLVRGGGAPPATAVALDAGVVALGPPALVARVEAVRAGRGRAVAEDDVFMRLRDAAMPERAGAATVRVTARLDFDARLGLARLLGADDVPASASVWADVVDDAAAVAVLAGERAGDGRALAAAIDRWRARWAADPRARAAGVAQLADRVRVDERGAVARAVWVVGPRALRRTARRLARRLGAPPGS
ncbi:MAG: hypothetical protein D6689_07050 [Deltaproteobacteria bacterium]|nr:MAG: hypothetical protein D6689_07050 [Deltaproteobacteria bacterium]